MALWQSQLASLRIHRNISGSNLRSAGYASSISKRATASTFSSGKALFSSSPSRRKDEDEQPWWSIASLHRRVVTILATSLPDTSRQALHETISESLGKNNALPKSHSINEAIVSARARDASLQHQTIAINHNKTNSDALPTQWIEKQQQLEKEMEKRALEKAKERMQLELKAMEEQWKRKEEERRKKEDEERQRELAFQKWQANVERERQSEATKKITSCESDADPMKQRIIANELSIHASNSPQHHHPILGPQVACLRYKRIHLTSASTLASLPVYEKQRAYRHDRAQNMAKDKKKTLWMGIPGVISLMEEEDGRLSILDGQHRVGMMALLQEEQRKIKSKMEGDSTNSDKDSDEESSIRELANLDLNNILVEVFPHRPRNQSIRSDINDKQQQPEQDDKAAIFTEINKAEPIKLLDLPGIANKRTRDIIDHAASHFRDTYPAMFSVSQKCRAPHLNLDNLREALFASDVIKREKITSGGEMVKWIARRNEELKERFNNIDNDEELGSGTRFSETALKKAKKHEFYLGLESTWLYK